MNRLGTSRAAVYVLYVWLQYCCAVNVVMESAKSREELDESYSLTRLL